MAFAFHCDSVHSPWIELGKDSSVTHTSYKEKETVMHRQVTEMLKTANGQSTITHSRTAH
jgi:hypothetical protein